MIERLQHIAALIWAFPSHEIHGRLKLQKAMFFAKAVGVPIPYEYRYLHFGPYSDGLKSDVDRLAAFEELSESVSTSGEFETVITRMNSKSELPTNEVPPATARVFSKIAFLVNDEPASALEVASTFYWYKRSGLSDDDAWSLAEQTKSTTWNMDGVPSRAKGLVHSLQELREVSAHS